MYNPNTLGQFLRKKRKEFGITILELSLVSKVSSSNISNIELGKYHSPTMINLNRLGDFYQIHPFILAKMIDNPSRDIQIFLKSYEMEQKVEK